MKATEKMARISLPPLAYVGLRLTSEGTLGFIRENASSANPMPASKTNTIEE